MTGKQAPGGTKNAPNRASEGLGDQTSAAAQRAYGQARDTVTETARDAADLGQAYYDEGAKRLKRRVDQQPITTLAMAVAVGFILARVL